MAKLTAARVLPLVVLASLALSACAAKHAMLAPTERLLVMRSEASAPMQVVLNDNPAGDAFLRTPARPLRLDDPALARLKERMLASVLAEKGVGIAAPQVGINVRVILVKRLDREPEKPFVFYFNPEIVEQSEETVVDWEGCLSVPAGFGKVSRAVSVVVEHDAPAGERKREHASGFTARIFQHEVDHLDGVLFIDRKEPGELMPEKEYREMRAREKAAGQDRVDDDSGVTRSPP
jgi:peptide deformylase